MINNGVWSGSQGNEESGEERKQTEEKLEVQHRSGPGLVLGPSASNRGYFAYSHNALFTILTLSTLYLVFTLLTVWHCLIPPATMSPACIVQSSPSQPNTLLPLPDGLVHQSTRLHVGRFQQVPPALLRASSPMNHIYTPTLSNHAITGRTG